VELHIGQKIREIAKKKRIGTIELAKLIHTSRQNLNAIYRKKSIDVEQLYLLSKALEFDLFALYTEKLLEEVDGLQYLKGLHAAAGISSETMLLEQCQEKYDIQKRTVAALEQANAAQSNLLELQRNTIAELEKKLSQQGEKA
jgi:transcriptional regulator with XRE-family HTH domain